MASALKRILVGKPISSADADHQRLSKLLGLPVFSSDAISSSAYATEEILFVMAAGGASLSLALGKLEPIAIAVAILLAIVVTSYRRTIFAYPQGGGSYRVSRENLGEGWSLVAAASLLIDYILTVAVSISAGVAAIISIPTFHDVKPYRVELCVGLVFLMMLANLRGVKESGALFAPPTYLYIGLLALLLILGLGREYIGGIFGDPKQWVFDPKLSEDIQEVGGVLGLGLILKGFASGAVALTGVEAISDGVQAFRRPAAKNAAATMMMMGITLGILFFGTALLAGNIHPQPSHDVTVMAQMGQTVFGKHNPLFWVLQFATAGILVLAANTAYADFPRLSQFVARDGYLPKQFANKGDRLVFSNGVVFLSVAASGLLVIFGGVTTALIPLYAVGVFTAFTLSQTGMALRTYRRKEERWRLYTAVSAVGAVVTFAVLVVVATTKFTSGAWVPIIVLPIIIAMFVAIKRHYARVNAALVVTPEIARPIPMNHTVVVLVGRIHRGVLKALTYARSLRPQHLVAVCIYSEESEREAMENQWHEFKLGIPLELVHSPYRDLIDSVNAFIEDVEKRWDNDTITVVIPEFVQNKWYQNALHNQTALRLKGSLLFREGVVVTSVPYHLSGEEAEQNIAEIRSRGLEPGAGLQDAAPPEIH